MSYTLNYTGAQIDRVLENVTGWLSSTDLQSKNVTINDENKFTANNFWTNNINITTTRIDENTTKDYFSFIKSTANTTDSIDIQSEHDNQFIRFYQEWYDNDTNIKTTGSVKIVPTFFENNEVVISIPTTYGLNQELAYRSDFARILESQSYDFEQDSEDENIWTLTIPMASPSMSHNNSYFSDFTSGHILFFQLYYRFDSQAYETCVPFYSCVNSFSGNPYLNFQFLNLPGGMGARNVNCYIDRMPDDVGVPRDARCTLEITAGPSRNIKYPYLKIWAK